MRPLVLATPKESRNRAGSIEPALAGLTAASRASWTLYRGLGEAATLLLSPEGSFDRSGPVEPTVIGDVPTVPGQYGPAWVIAEGTTNLLTSVSNNWHTSRELIEGEFPAATWRVTVTGEAGDEGIDFRQHTTGKGPVTLTYSVDVRADTDTPLTGLRMRVFRQWPSPSPWSQNREGPVNGSQNITITNEWQRLSMTATFEDQGSLASSPSHISAWIATNGAMGQPTEFYARNPQLEAKAYATPFTVGTRQYGTVHLDDNPVQDRPAYEVLLRGRFFYRGIVGTVLGDASHRLRYEQSGAVSLWDGASRGGAYRIAPGSTGVVGISFDGTDTTIIVNGQKERIAGLDYRSGGRFAVGYTGGDYVANMLVEGLIAFDRPLTDEERDHLLGLDRAWEWGPNGSVTVPLDAAPAEVYVRYRRGGVTLTSRLTEPGPLGDVAEVAVDASGITITAREDIEVLGVLAYEAPLPPYERLRVQTAETWAWDELARSVSPIAGRRTGLIRQTPKALVTIDGIPTPAEAWRCRHGVEQPIGSATITVPVGTSIEHIRINAPVEIQGGYEETGTQRVFLGTIKTVRREASIDGVSIRLECEGTTARLAWTTEDELVYLGRTRLRDIFVSFAEMRGLEQYLASRVTYPNGTTDVAFGGIAAIDDGDVVLKRRTSPLTWLTSKADLFGYRVFGTGAGPTRLQRVSGLPSGSPVASFTEGVDLIRSGTDRSKGSIVTHWTVYGARYTDDDGVTVEIRSIPAEVPPNPDVMPPGYVSGDESDSILTTQSLVNAVRQVREIDHSEASEIVTWETWGRPELQPGDVIEVTAPAVGVGAGSRRWLMSVEHHWSGSGFRTTLEGWAGAGTPLPAGIDETIIPVGTGPYRLGDEYLPHYVIPSAGGRETVSVPFTVPGDYTSLALTGRQHGTNSYLMDGVNTEASVSKLEVWQGGERVGSADLPVSPENLNQRLPYQDRRHWTTFRMPIPGRLEEGPAEMRIVSGRDNRAASQFALDDFEIENLAIEARGTGRAILPGRRT